ncbi:unnamed protein product [Cylicocyclus nassatus]|uniref:PH domain-containing protein n=1 Tax=Cylicocyclus nassatus TaxID=53992 RepID=A0AA36H915_CYLNA|nr:unnamed protein product [Cylicocyclus nassatus]
MKRIATRLKSSSVTSMADWPVEKCTEVPTRLEGMVSIKRRKRRVINIARKFYAVLDKGILKLFVKKKVGIAPNPEFQVDLAKVAVMYDEKRIILHFKSANETHTLTPLEFTLDQWKDAICKHRLHRQEAVAKGLQPDSNQTLEASSVRQRSDEKGWESQVGNKMFDEVHQMQGLTLEVLEKLTKTYEEMQKTNEEMKETLKNVRDTFGKSTMTESSSVWTTATTTGTPSTFPRSNITTTGKSSKSGTSTESKVAESGSEEEEDTGGQRKGQKNG